MTRYSFFALFRAQRGQALTIQDAFELVDTFATECAAIDAFATEVYWAVSERAIASLWHFGAANGWAHVNTWDGPDSIRTSMDIVRNHRAYLESAMALAIASLAAETDWLSDARSKDAAAQNPE